MNRFPLREFLWLCVPVAVVGAGVIAVRLLHPPRDPDAVIALSVTSISEPISPVTILSSFSVRWRAQANGGPQDDLQLFYAQKLVALGDGRSQVVFQEPISPTVPNVKSIKGAGGGNNFGPAFQLLNRDIIGDYSGLPIWTKRLEWRGDVVAIPLAPGTKKVPAVGSLAPFSTLARIKGAARVTKTFPVRLDAQKVAAFQELKLEKVLPINVEYGADICVTTQFCCNPSRICARIIAFDGKTKRELWSNLNRYDKRYWITGSSSVDGYVWNVSDFLKLRDVPAQWGELTYVVDAAFKPQLGVFGKSDPVAPGEIERLKRAGWFAYSKKLTLRKMGAKIVAPSYPQKPNTQFLSAQTSASKSNWIITVRLKYNGTKMRADESLDIASVAFFDAKNNYVNFSSISYNATRTSKPGEYLATITIPLKELGAPRPLLMKMIVADSYAAPLHFQTKLQVPRAPA